MVTDTHSGSVIVFAFPLQQWLHERASLLRLYSHCMSCNLELLNTPCSAFVVVCEKDETNSPDIVKY
jgi:hypothetical protein